MSMFPIASYTAPVGGSGPVSFASIPQTFTHLEIRVTARSASQGSGANNPFYINSDTGANYRVHYLGGQTSSGAFSGDFGASQTSGNSGWVAGTTAAAGTFGTNIISIPDYANTNKYKVLRSITGSETFGSTNDLVGAFSTLWLSTAAITGITFNSNWAAYSRFDIYGIKAA